MEKVYPIKNPIESSNFDKNTPIDMVGLPAWLREKMEEVAQKEGVDIRKLRYERELWYSEEDMRWFDDGRIIYQQLQEQGMNYPTN